MVAPIREGRRRAVAAPLATLGWFALAAQLVLLLRQGAPTAAGLAGAVIAYLSFFTILTNLGVALALTAVARGATKGALAFFGRPRVAAALAAYIAIVGLVYALLLRRLWAPTGLQWLADVLLHYAMPIAYLLYWLFFMPKGRLRWRDAGPWLLFPLGFLSYTLARGRRTDLYTYPFLDVGALGYPRVLRNVAFATAAFLAVGWLIIGLDRAIGRRGRGSTSPRDTP